MNAANRFNYPYPVNVIIEAGASFGRTIPKEKIREMEEDNLFLLSFEYVLETRMTQTERDIIRLFFSDKDSTYKELGEEFNIRKENMPQVILRLIRKLCMPEAWDILYNGLQAYLEKSVALAYEAGKNGKCEPDYDAGYKKGYEEGYKKGYREGYEASHGEPCESEEESMERRDNMDTESIIDNESFFSQFPVSLYNLLRRNKIDTIEDILSTPPEKLYKISGMGRKQFYRLAAALNKSGLSPEKVKPYVEFYRHCIGGIL